MIKKIRNFLLFYVVFVILNVCFYTEHEFWVKLPLLFIVAICVAFASWILDYLEKN